MATTSLTERIRVYRANDGEDCLDNSNGANLFGVLHFIDIANEDLQQIGDSISLFEVTVYGCFGTYVEFAGGVPRGSTMLISSQVGKRVRGKQIVEYSFPKGGQWDSQYIGSVKLMELRAHIKDSGIDPGLDLVDHFETIREYFDSL